MPTTVGWRVTAASRSDFAARWTENVMAPVSAIERRPSSSFWRKASASASKRSVSARAAARVAGSTRSGTTT